MSKSIRKIAAYTTPVLLLIVFLYVWPGFWRYTYYERGFVRLDKLTGKLYRRQLPRYNAIWSTLEEDLKEQRKRDPSLMIQTGERTATRQTSARLKEVRAAMEQHFERYHTSWAYVGKRRIGTYEPTLEELVKARPVARGTGHTLGEWAAARNLLDSIDYGPFSSSCEEAMVFALEKGYSVEEICSVRPVWCSLGIRNIHFAWKVRAEMHPGRRSVDEYEQALLHDWVPVQRQ